MCMSRCHFSCKENWTCTLKLHTHTHIHYNDIECHRHIVTTVPEITFSHDWDPLVEYKRPSKKVAAVNKCLWGRTENLFNMFPDRMEKVLKKNPVLQRQVEESREIYRTRIMLVGHFAAGKTSVKRSLLGEPFDTRHITTDGHTKNTCEVTVHPAEIDKEKSTWTKGIIVVKPINFMQNFEGVKLLFSSQIIDCCE